MEQAEHEIFQESDEADEEDEIVPMKPEVAQAAMDAISAHGSSLDKAVEGASKCLETAGPLQKDRKSYIKVSLPISLALREFVEKLTVFEETAESIIFIFNNGKAKQSALMKLSQVQPQVDDHHITSTAGKRAHARLVEKWNEKIIPRQAFSRLVKQIIQDLQDEAPESERLHGLRFSSDSMLCLQEAAELFISDLCSQAYTLTVHARRKTLMLSDLQLVLSLQAKKLCQ